MIIKAFIHFIFPLPHFIFITCSVYFPLIVNPIIFCSPPNFPQGNIPPGVNPEAYQWFQTVDTDHSGSINLKELKQALVNSNWSTFNDETCLMMISKLAGGRGKVKDGKKKRRKEGAKKGGGEWTGAVKARF